MKQSSFLLHLGTLLFLFVLPAAPHSGLCSILNLQNAETKTVDSGESISNNGLRMAIVHRDFSNIDVGGMTERMKLALQRSNRRLHIFQNSVKANIAARDVSTNDYRSPVSSADGAYLTTVTIGSPGVSFTAIVDTGSDLVWRQCEPCDSCYSQSGPIFNPSKSSTYKKASCDDSLCQALPEYDCNPTCEYTYMYGDMSSTAGDFSYDTLTMMDSDDTEHVIPEFGFGCGHDNGGGNFGGAGGILGLGQGSLSLVSQTSSPRLSYCLVSITDSSSQTSPMFIGKSASLTGSGIQSTPIITSSLINTYYYLGLQGISVGGDLLDIPSGSFDLQSDGSGGMIIDSGTTITYIINDAYEPLLSAFKSSIDLPQADSSAVGLDLCYKRSGEVPSLTFHFEGADFDFPTENYFIDADGLFCLAILGASDMSIFGNILQQNYHILYDHSSHTLSFKPATCDEV